MSCDYLSFQCFLMTFCKVREFSHPRHCDDVMFPPEAMPGNIRKAEHFVGFLRRFNEYMKVSFCCLPVELLTSSLDDVCRVG